MLEFSWNHVKGKMKKGCVVFVGLHRWTQVDVLEFSYVFIVLIVDIDIYALFCSWYILMCFQWLLLIFVVKIKENKQKTNQHKNYPSSVPNDETYIQHQKLQVFHYESNLITPSLMSSPLNTRISFCSLVSLSLSRLFSQDSVYQKKPPTILHSRITA